MDGSNRQSNEVGRRTSLRDLILRLWFDGVNKVREFYGVLDKKYGYVVSNKVPVSFFCIEFRCKSAYIPNGVL